MVYLDLFRADYYERKGSLSLLFALIVLFPVIASVMVSQSLSSIYIVPFAMIPIIVRIFLDSRTAFMAHVTIILLCSITLRFPHEFILLQVVAGMVSIYSLRESAAVYFGKDFRLYFQCYAGRAFQYQQQLATRDVGDSSGHFPTLPPDG